MLGIWTNYLYMPTQSLNRLIKPDYIVQVWGLIEVKIIACMVQMRNCIEGLIIEIR